MIKSFLFAPYRFVFVLFLLSVVLGGCGLFPVIPTPPPACPPVEANVYRAEPQRRASIIFDYAYPSTPIAPPTNTPDPANTPVPTATFTPLPVPIATEDLTIKQKKFDSARYAAFQYLLKETKRWSKIETVNFADSSEAEIVITFISPPLLQAVLLNNTLANPLPPPDFQSDLRNALDSVVAREELLFIMTVISPSNKTTLANHVIKLPIDSLTLNNAAKISLTPNHSDFNLGQPINTTYEAVFGYIGYPLAKKFDDGQCVWTLDDKYTEVVLSLPALDADGNVSGQRSWTIPYTPLVDSRNPLDEAPDFNMPENYNTSNMSPSATPPVSIKTDADWESFARFIWSKTTLR